MNLPKIEISSTCEEMIQDLDSYYHDFFREIMQLSNHMVNNYIEDYFKILQSLVMSLSPKNRMKAAIGVLSLHRVGYNEFERIAHIFDRIIPQVEEEYVKFTSYIAGQLVHHPDTDQTQYVSHLFNRIVGWITVAGRRQRLLAASSLLCSLSENAGNSIILFIPTIQTLIWHLVSLPFPSLIVLKTTAKAIALTIRSIIRYGRSELDGFLGYMSKLSNILNQHGKFIKYSAGLMFYTEMIKICPDYFIKSFVEISESICESSVYPDPNDYSKISAFSCAVSLAAADPKQFFDIFSFSIMDRAKQILMKDPIGTVSGLCSLCKYVPDIMKTELHNVISFSNSLIRMKQYDAVFHLLETYMFSFPLKLTDFYHQNFSFFISSPISPAFKSFFVKTSYIENLFHQDQKLQLIKLIENKLCIYPIIILQLISDISPNIFVDQINLFKLVIEQTNHKNYRVRRYCASALFNLSKSMPDLDQNALIKKLLDKATIDKNIIVRHSFIKVIYQHCNISFAGTDFLKYYKTFLNDDSFKVPKITLKILCKLAEYNPIAVTSITRGMLFDYFSVFQTVPSIRQQAKFAKLLPFLVKASLNIVKTFSESLIMTLETVLSPEYTNKNFQNFVEANAAVDIQIAVIKSFAIIAPYDHEIVGLYSETIIELLCSYLNKQTSRTLVLSVLNALQILLSPQASTTQIRTQSTQILYACTSLLAETLSRKVRMSILKVVGTIGVIDAHQKLSIKGTESPKNVDDNLARQFFQPSKDLEGNVDDSMLLNPVNYETYYMSVASTLLLDIFQDDEQYELHYDSACALINILMNPKMTYLVYFDSLVTRLLDVIERTYGDLKKDYLHLVTKLIRSSSNNISPFVPRTLEIAKQHFEDDLIIPSLDLILALINSLKDGFSPYVSDIINLLIKSLDDAKTCKKDISKRVLEAFSILGKFSIDFRPIILKQICDAIVCEQTLETVRTMALEALRILVEIVDIFSCIGLFCRAVKYALNTSSRDAALQLVYAFIIHQRNAAQLFTTSYIPEFSLSVDDVKALITDLDPHFTKSKKRMQKPQDRTKDQEPFFSEEAVITRAITPNLGLVRHLESWMNSLILTVIANSPNKFIRACQTVASSSLTFAKQLFRIAFFSCWTKLSKNGKSLITESFHQLLLAKDNYDSVVLDVLNILIFMDKVEQPLDIPHDHILDACIRYRRYAFALKILERIQSPMLQLRTNRTNVDYLIKMIDSFLQTGSYPNAFAVWKKFFNNIDDFSQIKLFTKLQMWDRAEAPFKKLYKNTPDPDNFYGLLETLSKLAKWNEIFNLTDAFEKQKKYIKQNVSQYFAEAAIHLGKWKQLSHILDYSSLGSIDSCLLNALNSIHNNDWEKVDFYVDHGFSLLASHPITFWEDKQRINREMMIQSQHLIEIKEMKDWLVSKDNPEIQQRIESVWDERLKAAPKDFEMWFQLIGNRVLITNKHSPSLLQFFQMKSVSLGTKIHTNAFEMLFPDYNNESSSDLDKLCYAVAKWNIGEKADALKTIEELTKTVGPELKLRTNFFYALWILESDDTMNMLTEVYDVLKSTVKSMNAMQSPNKLKSNSSLKILPSRSAVLSTIGFDKFANKPSKSLSKIHSYRSGLSFSDHAMKRLVSDVFRVEVLRKWSSVNTALIPLDNTNAVKYVVNAIFALNQCISLSPEFPDVAQLLNLFFEYANRGSIFEDTNKFISDMPVSMLLKVFPQILIQVSHQTCEVSNFVYKLIINLLKDHYHVIIFSIYVIQRSKIKARREKATELLQEFGKMQPEIANEVRLIRVALLRAAVTWYEKTLAKIQDGMEAIENGKIDDGLKIFDSIFSQADSQDDSVLHQVFQNKYGELLQALQEALTNYKKTNQFDDLKPAATYLEQSLAEETSKQKSIQLGSISKELCKKTSFHIAVPGTYKPNKPLIRIHYFVGQLGVYQSRQTPKNVCVKGDDGVFYQYLLKGHEDLRLDERLMQFFKLINSIVKKETSNHEQLIQTMSVIPLSMYHGLVQWVKGTDTLKDIVAQMRALHNQSEALEYEVANQLYKYDMNDLLPSQRMQIILKIFKTVPDTDIANFLWLKADNADIWVKQTNTFAVSAAVMSIVGYIIGLGDRHPSNLLIDKFTGKVVHIDFGDSFERAAMRSYKPEIVPFRLTRMMVRAMGITGVEGVFKNAFINMSQLLRDNRRVLLMVLAIFVQEPINSQDQIIEEVQDCQDKTKCQITRSNSVSQATDKSKISARIDTGFYRSRSKATFSPDDKENWDYENPDELSNEQVREQIKKKLMGREFDDGKTLSVEEQANILISKATNTYNLAKLFTGWCPYY